MATNPCPDVVTGCPCDDWPLNGTQEGPEGNTCFGILHWENVPPLGKKWETADCGLLICEVEQAPCQIIAEECVLVKGLNCPECTVPQ